MRTKKTDKTDGVNPVWRERMKQLRGEYSYRQVASLIGITPQNWYVYENGPSTPGTKVVLKMCQTFDVSADWLLGLSDVRTPAKEGAPTVAAPQQPPTQAAARRGSKKVSLAEQQLGQPLQGARTAAMSDLYKLNNLPAAALLAQIQELTDRVKALEAAAAKPAFACS